MPFLILLTLLVCLVIWLLTPVACICPACRENVNARASVCPKCHSSIKPSPKWLSLLTKQTARLGILALIVALLTPEGKAAVLTWLLKVSGPLLHQ